MDETDTPDEPIPDEIDGVPLDAIPTFRAFVDTTLTDLRGGAMWAGWTPAGVAIYGEEDDEMPGDVEQVQLTDDVGLAVMAGIIVTSMIGSATQRKLEEEQSVETFAPLNREQRRQRDRQNLRARMTGRR